MMTKSYDKEFPLLDQMYDAIKLAHEGLSNMDYQKLPNMPDEVNDTHKLMARLEKVMDLFITK